jgi:hypothetical protein
MVGTRPVELLRALAALCEPPAAEHRRLAEAVGLGQPPGPAEHADVFLFQFHPYASVYLGPEGMLGGEARARVAGFWRALGQTPSAEPDHLGALLGLYATLAEAEVATGGAEAVLTAGARVALLHEHLAPWAPFLLERVAETGAPFYGRWAALLQRVLDDELRAAPPPDAPPLHLRLAPPLPDPREEGAGAFLSGLLAPVRSGVILARSDLACVARELGLGARVGERRWVLRHLLEQEPAPVLEALAAAAVLHAERHAARAPVVGPSAVFWARRARATSALLRALAGEGRALTEETVEEAAG